MTLAEILDGAQSESGIDLASVTTRDELSQHLLRYRQRLLGRCATQWKDVAKEGAASAIGITGALLSIPAMEAIWEVRARKISDGSTPKVHVVPATDQLNATLRPRLMLRVATAMLLDYVADWQGKYDVLYLHGIPVLPMTGVAENTELAPSAILGDGFCRVLVLEGARFLALKNDDLTLAGSIAADRTVADTQLMGLLRSHSRLQATRQ